MSHYFDRDADPTLSQSFNLSYRFHEMTFTLRSDQGVFSHRHVDDASDLLMRSVHPKPDDSLLDLGCGYGVIGLVMARYYHAQVTSVDVNPKAIALTQLNFQAYNLEAQIILSDSFSALQGSTFDWIVSNPPIRIGKSQLYPMLRTAIEHLTPDGRFIFVMHKKHGVASAIRFLEPYAALEVIQKAKGFHVVSCKKH